jgi:hypothetical protein
MMLVSSLASYLAVVLFACAASDGKKRLFDFYGKSPVLLVSK